jgi:hypothetical protein
MIFKFFALRFQVGSPQNPKTRYAEIYKLQIS